MASVVGFILMTGIVITILILLSLLSSKRKEMFTMIISLENNHLYAQPQGSDKLELIPKAKNKFFIKEIGAEIEFLTNDASKTEQINILLEGKHMIGVKK